jgi:hypothetical protein
MLNVIIIIFIFLGLILHRYLTTFWEQGTLPYSMGFLVFANSFIVIYLISFIWMFGAIGGIVAALLCFLQIIYTAGLWVFALPGLISMHKSINNYMTPKVNLSAYAGFSFVVMLVAILTAVNFFVSPYKSMWEIVSDDIETSLIIFVGILVIGNITRMLVMSKFMKQ